MKLNRPIYLDNQSTTPVDPKVLEKIIPYYTEKFGNEASQTHLYGWEARSSIEIAREKISKLIGSSENEIYFTSGATESINLALIGIAVIFAVILRELLRSVLTPLGGVYYDVVSVFPLFPLST